MKVSRSNSRIKTGISIPVRTRPAPGDLGTCFNPQRSPFCRETALVIRTRPRSEPERLRTRRFPAERPAWPSGAVGRPLVAARWRGSSLRASVPHLAKYSPHRGLQDIRHLPRRRDALVPRATPVTPPTPEFVASALHTEATLCGDGSTRSGKMGHGPAGRGHGTESLSRLRTVAECLRSCVTYMSANPPSPNAFRF